MNSTKLNLNANNATFQLYQLKDSLNLNFYSIVDWDIVVKDTPLEENDIKHRVLSSSKRINHVADAFRLAVIYKIGGTYVTKIDLITLTPLPTVCFKDVVALNNFCFIFSRLVL